MAEQSFKLPLPPCAIAHRLIRVYHRMHLAKRSALACRQSNTQDTPPTIGNCPASVSLVNGEIALLLRRYPGIAPSYLRGRAAIFPKVEVNAS